MNEIEEDETKRIVLAQLMEQLGLTPEVVESDAQAAREQYESDQARDTYAYFGLAMYTAQVFEHEVVNLLVLARIVHAHENADLSWLIRGNGASAIHLASCSIG